MSPVERLETALTMSDQVMAIAAAGVRHRHPDLSPRPVQRDRHDDGVSSVNPAEVINPAACQVVPAVSEWRSRSRTSSHPARVRW
jgi:hypothetical protein